MRDDVFKARIIEFAAKLVWGWARALRQRMYLSIISAFQAWMW